MSIQETFHKIKRGLEAYNSMPIHLFIITLVGFSSFFLGRLSINTDYSNGQIKGDNIAINEVKGSQNFAPKEIKIKSTSSLPTTNTGQGEYLAVIDYTNLNPNVMYEARGSWSGWLHEPLDSRAAPPSRNCSVTACRTFCRDNYQETALHIRTRYHH
jgi:hypothetical protein